MKEYADDEEFEHAKDFERAFKDALLFQQYTTYPPKAQDIQYPEGRKLIKQIDAHWRFIAKLRRCD